MQPPLRVSVIGPKLVRSTKPIRESHPLYGILAALWHHGDTLPAAARKALMTAVLAGLPASPGRNGDDYNNVLVSLLTQMGVTSDVIAREWQLDPKSVPKKAKAGRMRRVPVGSYDPSTGASTFIWSIEAVEEQSELKEPLDPAEDDETLAEMLGMTPCWNGASDRAADLERFYAVLNHEVDAGRVTRVGPGHYHSDGRPNGRIAGT